MLTNNKIKKIKALQDKKYRYTYRQFIAEGEKMVNELLFQNYKMPSFPYVIHGVYGTRRWLQNIESYYLEGIEELEEVSEHILQKISTLKTANQVLAVVGIPEMIHDTSSFSNTLSLVLERIQDPGNLGTIIRTANWFNIRQIFCSPESVDVYNPKVVQATMGAIFQTNIYYTPLPALLSQFRANTNLPVYGSFVEGKNIYQSLLSKQGVIIMGNESQGISEDLKPFVTERLSIPKFNQASTSAESLNISAATAIICSEFKRRNYQ